MTRRNENSPGKIPSVELYCEQGRRLASAGDIQRATRVFQVACVQFSMEPEPWVGLALCLKKLGRSGVAELAISTARALGAEHPGLLVHRAECQIRRGDIEAARKDLLAAASEALVKGDDATYDRAQGGLEQLEGPRKRARSSIGGAP